VSFWTPIEAGLTHDKAESQKRHPLNIGNPEVRIGTSSSNGGGESSWVTGVELGIAAMVLDYMSQKIIPKNEEQKGKVNS
jgi:hypothetical protein